MALKSFKSFPVHVFENLSKIQISITLQSVFVLFFPSTDNLMLFLNSVQVARISGENE